MVNIVLVGQSKQFIQLSSIIFGEQLVWKCFDLIYGCERIEIRKSFLLMGFLYSFVRWVSGFFYQCFGENLDKICSVAKSCACLIESSLNRIDKSWISIERSPSPNWHLKCWFQFNRLIDYFDLIHISFKLISIFQSAEQSFSK